MQRKIGNGPISRGNRSDLRRQPDGSFTVYVPGEPGPPRITAGDRLRVHLEVADDAWIHAVAAMRKAGHWKLGAWPPGSATGGVRMLWPGGRVLTADDARMTTLFVIASREELALGEGPDPRRLLEPGGHDARGPAGPPCDHRYGLFWKVPRRPRGMVPPVVDWFQDGGIRLPAIVSESRGAPYTAMSGSSSPEGEPPDRGIASGRLRYALPGASQGAWS